MASEFGVSGVQSMGMPANVELPKDLKPAGTSGKRLLEIERARAVSEMRRASRTCLHKLTRVLLVVHSRSVRTSSPSTCMDRCASPLGDEQSRPASGNLIDTRADMQSRRILSRNLSMRRSTWIE